MMCHVASWLEPINHGIRVEIVKSGLERYRNKEGPFQSMFRVIKVEDSEKKSCELPVTEMFSKTRCKTVRRFCDHG